MSPPWMELVAAVLVTLRRTMTLSAGRTAANAERLDLDALAGEPLRRFPDAWQRQCRMAAAALKSLGIPPAPLLASAAGHEPVGVASGDGHEPVGVASGDGHDPDGVASGDGHEPDGVASGDGHEPDGVASGGPEGLRLRVLAAARETEESLEVDSSSDPLAARFEAVRSLDGRRRHGQHLTPATVVDLTLGLAGLPEAGTLLDPTCGTGTFLLRAAAWPGLAPEATLWGSDLDPLAAQLARINLARFPGRSSHIAHLNAFSLAPGIRLGNAPLPPPDAVVGNLPYVRLHQLDPEGTAATLTELAQRWQARDPALVIQRRGAAPRLRLGGHGDLYAMLLFHLAEVMPPPARFALLTSNAWLDDRYGEALRNLLCRHFALESLVESQCERWFPAAAVNTVILVAQRRERRPLESREPPPCRFVGLHRPIVTQGTYSTPRNLARMILEDQESPDARVREVSQAALQASSPPGPAGHRPRQGAARPCRGWSVHLRGTEIYGLLGGAQGLAPAGEWLLVMRGVTTNCNPFFYPKGPDAEGIEEEYLLPVVRSPRAGGRSLLLEASTLSARLFRCWRSEAELRELGHRGALDWIGSGKKRTTATGRPLPEVLTGRPWYAIRPRTHRVIFTKTIHDKHRHPLLDVPTALDQRLYGVVPRGLEHARHFSPSQTRLPGALAEDLPSTLAAAALNSSITALSAEIVGSTNLGEGALDLPVGRVSGALLVPDGRRLTLLAKEEVLAAFASLASRPQGLLWQEMAQPDRRALDAAWLAGLGLPMGWLPAIQEALEERVRIRLARASSGQATRSAGE